MRLQNISVAAVLLSVAFAVPFSKREQTFQGTSGPKLRGSSFGIARNATYDYVVVGGGNAGLTVAARLAQNWSVAVIEAGSFYNIENGNLTQIPAFDNMFTGKDPNDTNRVDWGFVTTPQKELTNDPVHYARGKTLGGCKFCSRIYTCDIC